MNARHLQAIERWNLALAAVAIAVAALLFDLPVVVGLAVGAVLCCANFWAIHRLVVSSMGATGKSKAGLQLLFFGKMFTLLLLVFLALKFLPMSPVAFAIGLSLFLISIAAESIRYLLGQRTSDGRA